ncbi:hypothetical protein DL93DRAFT_2170498 [Clavulina sp. PMI_390]|nr:hypothetical protein DL93DRAFT_2170498 [Clavulina sp. PMI_390]
MLKLLRFPQTSYGSRALMKANKVATCSASIHSLPDEIILSIFLHIRMCYNWREIGTLTGTVWLSQVCVRWRAIALATSALWVDIMFHAKIIRNPLMSKRAYDRIETCLLRSHAHPLNIHFNALDASSAISPIEMFKVFVRPNLWRCSILELLIPDYRISSAIFPFDCDLSRIQSFALDIRYGFTNFNGVTYDQPLNIGSTQNTTFSPLTFRITINLPANFPNFDGSKLEALYIADQDLRCPKIVEILSKSRNIQRMHLKIRNPKPLFQTSLTFPNLFFLSTIHDWPSQSFHAPALRKLFISEPWLRNDCQVWLELSAGLPHLQHLTIHGVFDFACVDDVETIISMLSCIPQLFTLELKEWVVKWLLFFVVVSPMTPSIVDTQCAASHDAPLSMDTPPPGATNYVRQLIDLKETVPSPTLFLPNLRLLVLSSADDGNDDDPDLWTGLDLGLQRILCARPQLSLYYDRRFMVGSEGAIEEGKALHLESLELGHINPSSRQEDRHIYSGSRNHIIV